MKNHPYADIESIYICPMHPEVTGKQGDNCTKCGMQLEAVQSEKSHEYQVQLITSPQTVEAEKPAKLTFVVKENKQIVPLDISHEMKIHLMAVSEDLTWFRHMHPEEQTDGTYVVTKTFPKGGKYLLFADFKPSGSPQVLHRQEIEVQGNDVAGNEEITNKWVSKTDEYRVILKNGIDFRTNKTQHLEISIEKNGRELMETNLQQYLGASAHIVMIGKVDKEFLHIHPVSDRRFPIFAQTHIEKAGVYRMWAQFKIDGKVHTADFTVDVAEGKKGDNEEKSHVHQN